jgi:hypothetical protein
MNQNRQQIKAEDIFNNSIQFTINGDNIEDLMHNLSSDYSKGFSISFIYDEVIEDDILKREHIYKIRTELFNFPKTVK